MKDNIVKPRLTLAKTLSQLVGRPYKLGGNGRVNGEPIDCFGLVVEYSKIRYGIDPCDLTDQYDYNDYADLYENDREDAFNMLRFFLNDTFVTVKVKFRLPGDIIICSAEDKESVAIYTGNQSMVVTTPEKGCHVMNTYYYSKIGAYRWPKQSL